MADKFLDVSAEFNGDGTASTPATADGGVGAWNDFSAVVGSCAPAYGTLEAGDIVYIRPADSSGSLGASVSSFHDGFDEKTPLTYIFEHPDWTEDGAFKVTFSGNFTIGDFLYIDGRNKLDFHSTTSSNSLYYFNIENAVIGNFVITTNPTPTYATNLTLTAAYEKYATVYNCNVVLQKTYHLAGLIKASNRGVLNLQNIHITVIEDGSVYSLFASTASYGGRIMYSGGSINLPDSMDASIANAAGGEITVTGVEFPLRFTDSAPIGSAGYDRVNSRITITDVPSRPYDFYYGYISSNFSWASGQNYPTLNALLPNGESWSLRFISTDYCCKHAPSAAPIFKKLYNQPSAVKTLTVEALINENFGTPDEGDMCVTFTYIDSENVQHSKRVFVPMASTAAWSATVYGAKTYNRFKFQYTTPEAIKQDSLITAEVQIAIPPTMVDDFMFFCPDIGVE